MNFNIQNKWNVISNFRCEIVNIFFLIFRCEFVKFRYEIINLSCNFVKFLLTLFQVRNCKN